MLVTHPVYTVCLCMKSSAKIKESKLFLCENSNKINLFRGIKGLTTLTNVSLYESSFITGSHRGCLLVLIIVLFLSLLKGHSTFLKDFKRHVSPRGFKKTNKKTTKTKNTAVLTLLHLIALQYFLCIRSE